jgi:hypothetical protein
MPICRGCNADLKTVFADLGRSPPSNEFKTREDLECGETSYQLRAYVCDECKLVQLPHHIAPNHIFNDKYAYFTSVVPSAVQHAKDYVEHITEELSLDKSSFVVEVAGNDGYLLQHFGRMQILNVEPAGSVADAAEQKNIPTLRKFFGSMTAIELAHSHGKADLIHGANVLAHTPHLRDFIEGLALLVKPTGTITLEFPWLKSQIEQLQLDTIYHEHYSYLSILALRPLFYQVGLRLYKVEHLKTLGGSLRLFLCKDTAPIPTDQSAHEAEEAEYAAGLNSIDTYTGFSERCIKVKMSVLQYLLQAKVNGVRVAGFGAPAKATTLLNYCGVGPELLPYVVDDSPAKIGKYIPGVQIPIYHPSVLPTQKPNHVLILAWNVADPIRKKLPTNITTMIPIPRITEVKSDLSRQPVTPWLYGYGQ